MEAGRCSGHGVFEGVFKRTERFADVGGMEKMLFPVGGSKTGSGLLSNQNFWCELQCNLVIGMEILWDNNCRFQNPLPGSVKIYIIVLNKWGKQLRYRLNIYDTEHKCGDFFSWDDTINKSSHNRNAKLLTQFPYHPFFQASTQGLILAWVFVLKLIMNMLFSDLCKAGKSWKRLWIQVSSSPFGI